ncbi:MAG: hypothetical protein JOZ62_02160 [Acidobacteriaceae bacterium]|nr:hypothetical protein [Acidobacteriaceae bacterium]
MRLLVCAAIVCVLGIAAGAQAPAEQPKARKEPPAGTLRSVTVKGNHRYASDQIVKAAALSIGQHVTGSVMERARVRLQDTQVFNSVSYEFRYAPANPPAYDVTLTVMENDQVFPMRFERFNVPSDDIRRYLREHVDLYSDEIPPTERVLRRYTEAVQTLVAQSNPSVKVKAAVSNDDPKQLAVLFTPDTPPPTIAQVVVSGNQAVDTGSILRAVNQVAIGVPLSDERLKLILDGAIKPLYAAKGYAAVTFPKIETEPSKTNLGVVVKVQINDGPAFKFGAIRFRGSGVDEDEIRANIPFKPGQTFNGKQIDEFRLNLAHRMRQRGYLDASVVTETETDDSKRAVNVTYTLIPGSIYNFAKLDIQGLDITSAPVIEHLWGEKPGKPFNPDYPDFFLKRVEEQGLFDKLAETRSDYDADPSTHNVTVHLYFKGGESKAERDKKKKEEEERRRTDGTWSPYPQLRART